MGDVLHSKAVLKLPADPARSAYLSLMLPMEGGKGEDYRCLP